MKKILSPMEKIRFPESEELPEGVKEIDVKDTFGYCTELYPDVEYAEHSGRKLHLQIMAPLVYGKDLKWPLIVYVHGSSWHKQKLFQSLPTLVRMCEKRICRGDCWRQRKRAGTISCSGNRHQKQQFVFWRMNGAHYGIDVSKVVLWGDSSGAHTALMAGITGDAEYLPEKYPQTTTEVDCIIDWFGPTDLMAASQYPSAIDHDSAKSPSGVLIGRKNTS